MLEPWVRRITMLALFFLVIALVLSFTVGTIISAIRWVAPLIAIGLTAVAAIYVIYPRHRPAIRGGADNCDMVRQYDVSAITLNDCANKKRLYSKIHPDKNPGCRDLAETTMKAVVSHCDYLREHAAQEQTPAQPVNQSYVYTNDPSVRVSTNYTTQTAPSQSYASPYNQQASSQSYTSPYDQQAPSQSYTYTNYPQQASPYDQQAPSQSYTYANYPQQASPYNQPAPSQSYTYANYAQPWVPQYTPPMPQMSIPPYTSYGAYSNTYPFMGDVAATIMNLGRLFGRY